MQILGAADLGRRFAEPAAILVDGGIDLDKVYSGQGHRLSGVVHRPFNVEPRAAVGVRMIVGISPVSGVEHKVLLPSAFVHEIVGQFRAGEGEIRRISPEREVRLRV